MAMLLCELNVETEEERIYMTHQTVIVDSSVVAKPGKK